MTPNQAEFDRLVAALSASLRAAGNGNSDWMVEELASDCDMRKIHALSVGLGGVAVLRKGRDDLICAGGDVFVLRERGSPRRCGGQGDILSGALAVAVHWGLQVV